MANPVSPRRADGDDGIDRTADLQEADGRFAPPGPSLPPPLHGVTRPMTLTLDFGPLPTDGPLVLALTGWLQYGTSSSNIALSQNPSVPIIRPTLEAETSDGTWVLLDVVIGLPAGKTKTILCPLQDKLPFGTRRLRLTTTYEIHWDRIVLCENRDLDASAVHDLKFSRAALDWRGFSDIHSRKAGHPATPDFTNVSVQPPWHTAVRGWYTRYGDVHSLISDADGQVVLLNGGDVLTLQAEAGDLPRIPRNLARTFLLYSVGWNKEGDPNTVGGDRVEPLPRGAHSSVGVLEDIEKDWQLFYNTRWVGPDQFFPNGSRN